MSSPLSRLVWVFSAILPCLSGNPIFACVGCVPEDLLRSEAYGINFSSDHIAVAIQHVNGSLEPISSSMPGPQYQLLMRKFLSEADIHPYGYDNDLPKSLPHNSESEGNSDIEILVQEITRQETILQAQNRNIKHYSVSMPIFFTYEHEELLRLAFKRTSLPDPLLFEPADYAGFEALTTTNCERHFEFTCDPLYEDQLRTTLYIEYNNSTLSAIFHHFWGGRYTERIAYFCDDLLGNRKYAGAGHWTAISHRIKALVKDHKDKMIEEGFYTNPLDVVLMGQLGAHPLFHGAVRDALLPFGRGMILPPTIQGNAVLDPVFVSALGVARAAKREIDAPKPRNCNVEDKRCTKIRDKVLQDSLVEMKYESKHTDEL